MTGSIFDQELGGNGTGSGIDAALGGAVVAGSGPTQNKAPAKADAAAAKVITTGLVDALNKYQKDLVKKGTYTIPDEYEIVIVGQSLKDAKIVPPGQVNLKSLPMGPSAKAPANQQKNPATQTQNNDAKNTSAFAGMSIIQFIDLYTRGSTYIYDQQTYVIDPKTGVPKPQGIPGQALAWYRIGLQAVPLTDLGEDPKRNDYAYKITYQLSPYKVNDVQSDYFPSSRYQGTHKRYDYWFTGVNTQVLKYEQDFNHLYYLTINSPRPSEKIGKTVNKNEYIKKTFSPRSAQASQGQEQPVNEPGANAADYLYSPGDQGRVKMTILGDPAWIQQGEVWSGVAGQNLLFGPFLADGSINYEGQEVLFEVAFNQPSDYNLNTGLMNPAQIQRQDETRTDSLIYRATEVISSFSKGQFTQELNGILVLFDLPDDNTQQLAETAVAAADRNTAVRGGVQTPRLSPSSALGETNGVTFGGQVGAEFGAYFNDGTTGTGTIAAPGRPTRSQVALSSSTLALEGFGDQNPPAESAPAPTAPTSTGQIVGPAASGAAAVASLGGASGQAVGQPVSVQVFTIAGSTVTVTSVQQVRDLFNQGRITAQAQRQAELQLNRSATAANSPTASGPPQLIAREP